MGQVQEPKPVKFIVGILAISEEILAQASELIGQQLGAVESASEVWPFSSTKYYVKEMSETLLRQFVSLAQPAEPTDIVKLKARFAGKIEPIALGGIINPSRMDYSCQNYPLALK